LQPVQSSAEEQELVKFVSFVLDDAQKNWAAVFAQNGARYTRAKLVLFRNAVQTGCGDAQSASGPFYCPADQKVYIDLGFYDELRRRFGAPGDFAQAYVLAHEIGHHIQNLLGTERKMRQLQQQNPGERNELSVRLELQADCYAGIWGKHAQAEKRLDDGDVDEALKAASAVGDDRISEMTGNAIRPESFTHGSAAQRTTWFRRGFDSGQIDACDTFSNKR
jgi:predicted metalloprotease